MKRLPDDPLWLGLCGFEFDQVPSLFTFAQRLARENDWTPAYTQSVLEEYRRFLYLAVRAGHPVTPSDQVDQAWHLHLVFTESYWNDLCRDVLQRPLHHGPTRGGAEEASKFGDWYGRTLASYERFFGAAPPPEIWPASGTRFAPSRFQRIDTKDCWVISRPNCLRRLKRGSLMAAGCLTLITGLAACSGAGDAMGIACSIGFVVVLILIVKALGGGGDGGSGRGAKGGKSKNGCGGGCGSNAGGCSTNSSNGHSGQGGAADSGGSSDGGGSSDSGGGGSGCGGGCGGD